MGEVDADARSVIGIGNAADAEVGCGVSATVTGAPAAAPLHPAKKPAERVIDANGTHMRRSSRAPSRLTPRG